MPSTKPTGSPRPRILEFDAVRGLAALAVVLFHYTTRYGQLYGQAEGPTWEFRYGDYGVQLFFMLSGFVIFMTLARTVSVMDFIVGRFSRLYPAYWAAVLVTFAAVSWCNLPGKQVTGIEALVNLTMVQQLLGARHVDGVYWSLQVELLFYVAMLALYRCGAFRRVWTTLFVWVAAGLCVHTGLEAFGDQSPVLASVLTKLQTLFCLKFIHLFAIGTAFYQVYKSGRLTISAVAAIAACIVVQGVTDSWWGAALVAGFVGLFHAIINGRLSVLNARPLVWLGGISYPLYLLHQNIGYLLIRRLNDWGVNANLSVAAACILAITLAAALTRMVERPAMTWIKGVYRRTRGGFSPAVARQLN